MNRVIPCVLMRAGTSRGPFFLREWLPADERARDEALIGAIGASDLLPLDEVGGGERQQIGDSARAFFHQVSKCRTDVTSLGIRWS